MLRIQYGLAGFFSGVFIAFLLGLLEMRIIGKGENASTILFFSIGFTVMVCGITGMGIGLKKARRREMMK